jgi:hypothetical protein
MKPTPIVTQCGTMFDVAALFVEPDGIYSRISGVDVWDADRDARLYTGPHPVVCHPPCQRWTNFAALNFRRWGGEHNRPGNDGGCFASALKNVRAWGGVLEHPAFSKAWKAFELPKPGIGWCFAERGPNWRKHYVCEVFQSAYGHRAQKRTWLYYVGANYPGEARWERNPGTHQVGGFDRIKPVLGEKEAAATPAEFADFLIKIARGSLGANRIIADCLSGHRVLC